MNTFFNVANCGTRFSQLKYMRLKQTGFVYDKYINLVAEKYDISLLT